VSKCRGDMRILLTIAYDGTDFAGWQVQPGKRTVQGELEDALSRLYVNQVVRIHGSGRTDAGVHALAQTATFDPPSHPKIPLENLKRALNHSLRPAILVRGVEWVPDGFHARFSAVGKIYTYTINRGENLPLLARWTWRKPDCPSPEKIAENASALEGERDFSSFTTARKDIDNAVRTIYSIKVREKGELLEIAFHGSGFLYKMVRGIVGVLVPVAGAPFDKESVSAILEARDRTAAPECAPPQGLSLTEVIYPENSKKMDMEDA